MDKDDLEYEKWQEYHRKVEAGIIMPSIKMASKSIDWFVRSKFFKALKSNLTA